MPSSAVGAAESGHADVYVSPPWLGGWFVVRTWAEPAHRREWNGPYAALLFINAWEYTRDVEFAKNTTLPLLEGLNAWSHCFLQRSGSTLEDWNDAVPDQVRQSTASASRGARQTIITIVLE